MGAPIHMQITTVLMAWEAQTGRLWVQLHGWHFQTLQGSLLLRSPQSFRCHYLVELEGSPSAVFLVNTSPGRANDSREDVLHLCDELHLWEIWKQDGDVLSTS